MNDHDVAVFIADLVRMHDRAFRLGLLKTGHAIGQAVRQVGWEYADLKTKERKEKRT